MQAGQFFYWTKCSGPKGIWNFKCSISVFRKWTPTSPKKSFEWNE